MSEDEEITFNFKVDRGNYDEGMKALETLDYLEKEAKRLKEIDFDAMEEDISKIASTETASNGKYFTFLFQILLLAQKSRRKIFTTKFTFEYCILKYVLKINFQL